MYGTRPLASDGTRGGPQSRAILEPLDALRARSRSRGAQPATRHGQHQFDVCRVLLCQLGTRPRAIARPTGRSDRAPRNARGRASAGCSDRLAAQELSSFLK